MTSVMMLMLFLLSLPFHSLAAEQTADCKAWDKNAYYIIASDNLAQVSLFFRKN